MIEGLKELEELQEEFVFVAAHELRTPVTAIKGYVQLVLEETTGPIDKQAKEFLSKVVDANNRLLQLVEDLLEVARSEAGRLIIEVAPIDIIKPIEGVYDQLKPLADEKNVSLVYKPKDVPKVMADEKRINEIVVNLVGNAIKYMGGEGIITISHEKDEDKNMLITHVADNGMGMSKEGMENLFQKFYRVQTEETQEITGTGLGLFIVKQIIEKMGGTIWVESEEGKGSVFSFSLPISKE